MNICHLDDSDDDTMYMPIKETDKYNYNVIDMILKTANMEMNELYNSDMMPPFQPYNPFHNMDTSFNTDNMKLITLSLNDLNKMMEKIIKDNGYVLPSESSISRPTPIVSTPIISTPTPIVSTPIVSTPIITTPTPIITTPTPIITTPTPIITTPTPIITTPTTIITTPTPIITTPTPIITTPTPIITTPIISTPPPTQEFTNTIKENFETYRIDILKENNNNYNMNNYNSSDYNSNDYNSNDYKCRRKIRNYTHALYIITIILFIIVGLVLVL